MRIQRLPIDKLLGLTRRVSEARTSLTRRVSMLAELRRLKECLHSLRPYAQNDQRLVQRCGLKSGIASGVNSSPFPGSINFLGSSRSPVV